MKIGLVLHELHRSENDLAHRLLQVSERHKVDHEIYHLARYLSGWSQRHVREIAEIGQDYGQDLDPEPRTETGLGEELREKGTELVGRRSQAALPMLIGLREVHTTAPGVSADWETLAQAAQGIKHRDLLDVTQRWHPDTLRQLRWANGKLKETSTRILVS